MAKVVTIQNVDRIVRPGEYYAASERKLVVTSSFRTIQGEGPHAGRPSIFLRLSGCNFGDKKDHCQFCDTSFGIDQGRVLSFEDLLLELKSIDGYSERDILVITGGEPTLQPGLIPFLEFIEDSAAFDFTQIETNGTQTKFFAELEEASWGPAISVVVSPKASMKAGRYTKPSRFVIEGADCFKFVVTADPDDPHHEIPDWAWMLTLNQECDVYVSPMAVYKKPYAGEVSSAWDHDLIDAVETSKNYSYAAEYALRHNLRLSIQQHLFLGVA